MDKNNFVAYKRFVKSIGQILALSRLYTLNHLAVKTKIKEIFVELVNFISASGTLIFSESPEATLLVNGEEIKSEDGLMARFIQSFRELKIGSLDFKPQITLDEFCVFIDLLNNAGSLKEKDGVIEFLKEKNVTHLVPSFASYKLVNEHEVIIKDGTAIKIEDLPPEVMQKFSLDLNNAEVNKKLKEGDQVYQILAHDPETLSRKVIDHVKDKDQPGELTKILWLIGDYLIDEIGSVKQGEANRKVLNELKDRILISWEEKQLKVPLTEETHKAFVAINAALQIKGLMALYKKHRKELATITGKLKNIIKTIPPESQLYRKIKEDLDKIGPMGSSLEISL
jgi:hypothetical protein